MHDVLTRGAHDVDFLRLIPLFPAIGALLNAILGSRLQRRWGEAPIHAIAVGAMVLSTATAIYAVARLLGLEPSDRLLLDSGWRWIFVQGMDVNFALSLDPLSSVMVLVVTIISTLIHVYSIGYMHGDGSYWRYFCYLNFFVFMMLTLILGDNFLVMFVGWEGVGLASYLLIGFWYQDLDKARAGMKAFITNRFGDAGFLMGLFALLWAMGGTWDSTGRYVTDLGPFTGLSATFRDVAALAPQLAAKTIFGFPLLGWVCIFFFWGATAKSAQIPLYVWLPDAMAGPTPVSALIHAATMVTAGVYMVARLNFLFAHSPEAMTVVTLTGVGTALFAATMGFFQHDIKKVLAYSTVSQLGFMFIGVGVGAYWAGIFHLTTHACFKACLFLGSGSVILGMHHEQDMRKMGGLAGPMPITRWTYLIACIAIAGFPIASGFFSKDEILLKAFTSGNLLVPGPVVWTLGFVAALGTAFYMFRSYYMTFSGTNRRHEHVPELYPKHDPHGHDPHAAAGHASHDDHGHHGGAIHESPRTMTWVLAALAFLAVVTGPLLGFPHHAWLEHFLHPVMAGAHHLLKETHHGPGLELTLMALSTGAAFAGWLIARALYKDAASPLPARWLANPSLGAIHKVVYRKYYVDEIYAATVLALAMEVTRVSDWFDRNVIDRLVDFSSLATRAFSFLQGGIDLHLVDGSVNLVADGVIAGGRGLRKVQTGRIQDYVYVLVAGAIALAIVFSIW